MKPLCGPMFRHKTVPSMKGKSLIDRLALLLRDTESERAVKMNISLKTSGEIAMEKSTGG